MVTQTKMTVEQAIETLREWADSYDYIHEDSVRTRFPREAVRVLADALAEREQRVTELEDALRDIIHPKTGPTGFLSRRYGGTGFPGERARAALGSVAPAKERTGMRRDPTPGRNKIVGDIGVVPQPGGVRPSASRGGDQ